MKKFTKYFESSVGGLDLACDINLYFNSVQNIEIESIQYEIYETSMTRNHCALVLYNKK